MKKVLITHSTDGLKLPDIDQVICVRNADVGVTYRKMTKKQNRQIQLGTIREPVMYMVM